MIRGTTAQFKFKLPYLKEDVLLAEAKFWQPNNSKGLNQDFPLPITKAYKREVSEQGDIVTNYPWNWIDNNTLVVRLGQQETLTFSDKYKARVQIRVRTADGLVFASTPQIVTVYPIYGDEPLGEEVIPSSDDQWVVFDGDTINGAGDTE